MVVVILGILGVAGSAYLGSYQKNLNLEKDARQITSYLELARSRSMAKENNKVWGIHFENPGSGTDFFKIYSTDSDYAGGTVSETIYLSSGVEFSDPSSGNTEDIQPSKLSGEISNTASIAVISGSTTKTITVNKKGMISAD